MVGILPVPLQCLKNTGIERLTLASGLGRITKQDDAMLPYKMHRVRLAKGTSSIQYTAYKLTKWRHW